MTTPITPDRVRALLHVTFARQSKEPVPIIHRRRLRPMRRIVVVQKTWTYREISPALRERTRALVAAGATTQFARKFMDAAANI